MKYLKSLIILLLAIEIAYPVRNDGFKASLLLLLALVTFTLIYISNKEK